MAIAPLSWKDYLAARMAAIIPIAPGSILTMYQDNEVRQISWGDLLAEILKEAGGGEPVTLETEAALIGGLIFVNPAEETTVSYHLPVYADVSLSKQYRVMNIGQGLAQIDALDGKLIGKEQLLPLAPGDGATIAKDGVNWQTIR